MWYLQGGSYIPGFSRQAYGAGLQRDVTKTRKDQAKKAAALQKYQSKRGSLGKWGGMLAGAAAGALLTPVLGPGGVMVGKALASGLGSAAGSSKFLSGKGPSMAPGAGTGLLGSTYEQLGEAKGGIDEAMRGQAFGAGAASLASGLTGMAGDKLAGLTGMAGDKLGAQFGDMAGARTPAIENTFGLDVAGARTPSLPGFEGYGGLSLNPTGGAGGLYSPAGFQSGGALGKSFGLRAIPQLKQGDTRLTRRDPSRSSKWFTPEAGSEMSGMQEKLRGMAGEGLLFDPETGDPMELTGAPEESMLERIKGAAGSMFNPFHGVEKEAPMQQYAQQLSPDIMSLLEEYGGKDEPERAPFDLMGKLGGLGRGAGNLLSSVINPFHGMEREAPRSSWTGQPMQMGGMMPGGVSNALPYQRGGFQEKLENLTPDWEDKLGSNLYTEEGDYTREGLLKMLGEPQSSQIDTVWGGQSPNQAMEMMINGRTINLSEGDRWEADKLLEESRLKEQWRQKDPRGFKDWTKKKWGSGDLFDEMGGSDEDFFGDDFQTGGMIQRYNLGGSVIQQPMAYQLGGLLKYKRSPMMG